MRQFIIFFASALFIMAIYIKKRRLALLMKVKKLLWENDAFGYLSVLYIRAKVYFLSLLLPIKAYMDAIKNFNTYSLLFLFVFLSGVLAMFVGPDKMLILLKGLAIEENVNIGQFVFTWVDSLTMLSGIIIPLTLTFYLFTYKEQNRLSESSNNIPTRNNSLFNFIVFSIVTFGFSLYIKSNLTSNYQLIYNETFILNLQILIVLVILSVLLGMFFIIDVLNHIRLEWLINNCIKRTKKYMGYLLLTNKAKPFNSLRIELFEKLNIYTEAIYQLFRRSIELNMDTQYSKAFKKWGSILSDLQSNPANLYLRQQKLARAVEFNFIAHPLKSHPDSFRELYKLIIKNHYSLIITLFKHHKVSLANSCIEEFLKLIPKENDPDLRFEYIETFYNLLLFLNENQKVSISRIAKDLEIFSQARENKNFEDFYVIYHMLIKRAVEDNDLRMLTTLPYSVLEMTNINDDEYDESARNESRLSRMERAVKANIGPENIEVNNFLIFTMLFNCLKSIELSNYASTGFITKFIVTNFDTEYINNKYREFIKRSMRDSIYIDEIDNQLFYRLGINFEFNKKTKRYCLEKLTVLLYGQQKYIYDNKLYFCDLNPQFIDVSILQTDSIDYVFNKLIDKKEYGLSYLDNKAFIGKLKREVRDKLVRNIVVNKGEALIPEEILKKLGINVDDEVVIQVDGKNRCLIIQKFNNKISV